MRIQVRILIVLFMLIFPFTIIGQEDGKLFFKKTTSRASVLKAIRKNHRIFLDVPITSSQAGIALAESLLFKVYGKKLITREKPYYVYSNKLHLYIHGTIPERSRRGTFNIIINKKTGEVIRLIHYK